MLTVVKTPPPTVRQSASEYCAAGWKLCIVAHGTKAPNYAGWNDPTKAIGSAMQLPDAEYNVGLLHALSGTCALDLDDLPLAKAWLAERGIDLEQLLGATDAVQIVSGRPGSGKLLYRLPKPLPSKRIVVMHEGQHKVAFELRCATTEMKPTQDVLPPSLHPSGSVYQWAGAGDWSALPVLPDAILKVWEALLEGDKEPRYACVRGEHAASIDEITGAVMACDPDSDRTPWRNIGMGLKKELGGDGFDLWDRWSQQSDKYNAAEMPGQWKSFNNDHPNPVTIGTMFHHARERGWVRPQPDVSRLFAASSDNPSMLKSPAEIITELCPTSPPVPVELLPRELSNYATEVADTRGCDVLVPTFAGLAALSGAIDARCTLTLWSDFVVPPVIHMITLGDPADKKTPGSKPMFQPLYEIERDYAGEHAVKMLAWEVKEARHAAQRKALKEWSSSPEAEMPNAAPPVIEALEPKPVDKMIVITDFTTAAIIGEAASRPYGFLCYRDELSGLYSRLVAHGSVDDRSVWTVGYEAGPYRNGRTGSGRKDVDCLALSLYGNLQVKKFQEFAPKLEDDGLLQRAVVGIVDPASRIQGNLIPDWMSSREDYRLMIRRAHSANIMHYFLDAGGFELAREFEREMIATNDRLTSAGYDTNVTGAVGKVIGLSGRFMLLFHMGSDKINEGVVPESTVRNAIAFCKQFVLPSIFAASLTAGRDPLEKAIVRQIIVDSAHGTVTMRELKRSMKAHRGDADDWRWTARLNTAMTMLEQLTPAPWVFRIKDNNQTMEWAINPSILTVFAAERASVISDREAFIERIKK